MKLKLKSTAAALSAVGLMAVAGTTQSAILLQNWQFNLDTISAAWAPGGTRPAGFGIWGGIEQLAFQGLFHTETFASNNPGHVAGTVSNGDIQTVNLLGAVTAATGPGFILATSTGAVLNVNFEITFASTTNSVIGPIVPPDFNNSHLGPGGPAGVVANGILEIYADMAVNADTSFVTGGSGMQNGVLIARLQVLPQPLSGVFNTVSNNGSDDATFVLLTQRCGGVQVASTSATAGCVLQDSGGLALVAGATLGLTDSDTDADADSNGLRDTRPAGMPASAGICTGPAQQAPDNVCGTEDGSFVLQVVPEPASLALIGMALAGLGLSRRRKVSV